MCNDGVCQTIVTVPAGEDCDKANLCEEGTFCDSGECRGPELDVGLGDWCSIDICSEGLVCSSLARCVTGAPAGQACSYEVPCAAGLVCFEDPGGRVCGAPRTEGGACSSPTECAGGFFCGEGSPGAAGSACRRDLEAGLTDELLLADGTRQPIMFARESSQGELAALSAVLKCGVFGTRSPASVPGDDAFEQRLFLVGELRHKVLRTPEGPDRATPEDYREFVLRTWYLEAPFSVSVGFATGELESLGHARRDTSIRHACPTITAHGDLDRFVRAPMK